MVPDDHRGLVVRLFPGKYWLFKVGDTSGPAVYGDLIELMDDRCGWRVDLTVLKVQSDDGPLTLRDFYELS